MSEQLARKDLFYIEFTKLFIPDEINNFYKGYVCNMPTQVDDPRVLVEGTVQYLTVPSYQYDAISQGTVDTSTHTEKTQNYRANVNPQELSDKQLTIGFKLLSGYINYFILQDTFFWHYEFSNRNQCIGDISLRILDDQGLVMMTRKYKDCLLNGISEFELSYSENQQTFETFNIDLTYSAVETEFGSPGNPINFGKKVN